MNLHIHALCALRLEDFLRFFDDVAFSDNPEWAGCYCVYNHFSGTDDAWMQRNAADNREEAICMIEQGSLTGFLAYDGDAPIGWCNAGDKASYTRFSRLLTAEDQGIRICAATCFITAPAYRRMGIAQSLLRYACEALALKGYDMMEAYPTMANGSCAMHYHGHPSMLMTAGFSLYQSFDGCVCMQKLLGKGHEYEPDSL